jgi:hypothetical protein
MSLCTPPPLHLLLAQEGIFDPVVLLEVEQAHRKPAACVLRTLSVVVLGEPAVEIPRAADLQGSVAALKDVHEGNRSSLTDGWLALGVTGWGV